jgi:hypothetical protein
VTETRSASYRIEKTDRRLIFRTTNFVAERGSVLHRGIYSQEFASALSSLAVAALAYMVVAINVKRGILAHVVFLMVFVSGFLLLKRFVFKDKFLEAVFDRPAGKTEISIVGITKRMRDSFPIKDIENVLIERKKSEIENPDAVEFVEKISSQHGMAIPGFGEERLFFLLTLKLHDGTDRLIFADSDMPDVMKAHDEIKEFLEKT